jgi:hypothetical protein
MYLDQLLTSLGKDHFYIMHLSYGGFEKERLWSYAVKNRVIGLDNSAVTDSWTKIRESARKKLKAGWINQFDEFCYEMEFGDIVAVLDGQKYVLGVASIIMNQHKYCRKLREERLFFDHIRRVEWLQEYDFNNSFEFSNPVTNFDRTIDIVKSGSKRWPIFAKLVLPEEPSFHGQKVNAISRNILISRKYSSCGEGPEHRKLKESIFNNPESIGFNNVENKWVEYPFISGDVADVVFKLSNDKYATVEIETTNPLPGCHQALKYKVLMCAELERPITSTDVEAVLVAWSVPKDTKEFCRKFKIKFIEKKRAS